MRKKGGKSTFYIITAARERDCGVEGAKLEKRWWWCTSRRRRRRSRSSSTTAAPLRASMTWPTLSFASTPCSLTSNPSPFSSGNACFPTLLSQVIIRYPKSFYVTREAFFLCFFSAAWQKGKILKALVAILRSMSKQSKKKK